VRLGHGFIHPSRALFSILDEDPMRNLFALLALIGVAGIVFGVLTIVAAAPGQAGRLGFAFENYGGPGSILGGLTLCAVSIYLRSAWRGRD
jgi:hypothetical protein